MMEQESDSCQHEQDHECDGDELFAVKGKGKGESGEMYCLFLTSNIES